MTQGYFVLLSFDVKIDSLKLVVWVTVHDIVSKNNTNTNSLKQLVTHMIKMLYLTDTYPSTALLHVAVLVQHWLAQSS